MNIQITSVGEAKAHSHPVESTVDLSSYSVVPDLLDL